MKKYIALAALAAVPFALSSAHADSAFVEQAASLSTSLSPNPLGTINLGIEYPLPGSLGLPVDVAVEGDLYTTNLFQGSRGFGAKIGLKALVLPSLINDPAVALAIKADASITTTGAGTISFGPLATLDFTPLTVSAGLFPALNNGQFSLNYQIGGRYYLSSDSNNAIEVTADATSAGFSAVTVGFRLAF